MQPVGYTAWCTTDTLLILPLDGVSRVTLYGVFLFDTNVTVSLCVWDNHTSAYVFVFTTATVRPQSGASTQCVDEGCQSALLVSFFIKKSTKTWQMAFLSYFAACSVRFTNNPCFSPCQRLENVDVGTI